VDTKKRTEQYRHIILKDDTEVVIYLNARESMVFPVIKKLPKDPEQRQNALRKLKRIVYEEFGGKTATVIPPEYLLDAINAGFPAKPSHSIAHLIARNDIARAVRRFQKRSRLNQEKFTLVDKKVLQLYPDQLYRFKCENSYTVTEQKKNEGRYSPFAELEKLKNPYVEHFALLENYDPKSTHAPKIVAYFSVAFHGSYAYISDFITISGSRYLFSRIAIQLASTAVGYCCPSLVDKLIPEDFSLEGLLSSVAFEAIIKDHSDLRGVWFISSPLMSWVPSFLVNFLAGYQLKPINHQDDSLIIHFTQPGPKLLDAANRSREYPYFTLDYEPSQSLHCGTGIG